VPQSDGQGRFYIKGLRITPGRRASEVILFTW